jgi:GH18 family chitinase
MIRTNVTNVVIIDPWAPAALELSALAARVKQKCHHTFLSFAGGWTSEKQYTPIFPSIEQSTTPSR